MPSQTDCLNDALGQIGSARITSIDDGSTNANHCLTFYPALRDSMLRGHFWNFALVWQQLAQDVPAPTIGYAYSYELPPNMLRLKDYAGALPTSTTFTSLLWAPGVRFVQNYKIEGSKLRTNDGQAFIQFIERKENPDEWDAMFYQAVATMLASKLAMAIRKDPKLSMALLQQAESFLSMAMSVDGQEDSPSPLIVDDLTWGR
jgi:hypothetical protein